MYPGGGLDKAQYIFFTGCGENSTKQDVFLMVGLVKNTRFNCSTLLGTMCFVIFLGLEETGIPVPIPNVTTTQPR